jgi:tetratricopeptide (TPR) repeat protein
MSGTKTYLFALLSVFMMSFSSFGQDEGVDSLRSFLVSPQVAKATDSVRIGAMRKLAWLIVYSDPDSAMRLGKRALAEAQRLGRKRDEAACDNAMGWFYHVKSEYDVALDYYAKSQKIWEELKDDVGMAATYGNMGSIYSNMGDFPRAMDYYLKSQKINEKIGNKTSIAIEYNNV